MRPTPQPRRRDAGFTLIELLIVVAIIGIVASIAIAGVQRARMAANESSAVASLRVIVSAEMNFSASCGNGYFAADLQVLGTPRPDATEAYISPDMIPDSGSRVEKSGYTVELVAQADAGAPAPCNGGPVSVGFYAFADPLAPGSSGNRYFWSNARGTIYQHDSTMSAENVPGGRPAIGRPIE